jgi:TolB protein
VQGINSDLWRLPVSPQTGRAAGKPERVLATTRVESRGAWSPDSRRIAFNSDRAGEMNIWLWDSTRRARQVTFGPGGDYQPTWSPDAGALVFFSARGGNTDIWRIRLRDSVLTRLTDDPALDTNPFYSPDGKHIAFVSDRTGRSEVWVMSSDGSNQRQLASVGCWGHFLLWSGDSRAVVFRGESDRQVQVFRVDIASSEARLLPSILSGGHMSFSPSQSLVMDVRGHKVLWAHPMDGTEAYAIHQFADPGVRIDYPVWSPDGRWILFDRAEPRGGDLWTLEGFPE